MLPPAAATWQEYCKTCMAAIRETEKELDGVIDERDVAGIERVLEKCRTWGVAVAVQQQVGRPSPPCPRQQQDLLVLVPALLVLLLLHHLLLLLLVPVLPLLPLFLVLFVPPVSSCAWDTRGGGGGEKPRRRHGLVKRGCVCVRVCVG